MKLLLLLLLSLKINNIFLLDINVEKTTPENFSYSENTTELPCARITIRTVTQNTQKNTSIEESSTDTTSNITSNTLAFFEITSSGNETNAETTSASIPEFNHTNMMSKPSITITSAKGIAQKPTTTPMLISTQKKTAGLPKSQHQNTKTNKTLHTSFKVTPFHNTIAKVKGPKQKMQIDSKFTILMKSSETTSTPSKITHTITYTRFNWSISISQPITKEIDFKESIEFGEKSFKKFMFNTTTFVDKSLMIKEFLEHDKQVILITRPVLWGKSLNLNMLRKFFEIEVDQQGNILPEENRVNRKIFCGGTHCTNDSIVKSFQPLKITNFSSAMKHQGKHPVLQLNYHFIRNGNFDDVKANMKYEVIKSYKKHFYLDSYFRRNPQFLDECEKSQLERYSKGDLTEDDLVNSLRFLSQLLYKYFNQTVFILIDEYETPLKDAFLCSSDNPDNLKNVLKFYQDLYTSAFKNNPYLAKGFLTGVLRIANSNLFINLDNMAEYTLLDHEFSQFYGFTESEFDHLVGPSFETELQEMKHFYKGYHYGEKIMYNPWSIIQCIENNYKVQRYWLRSQLLFPVHRQGFSLDHIEQDVRSLLENGCVEIPIRNEVSFDNLTDRTNFFNFILFTGYLSPAVKYPNETYQLVRPNSETMLYFEIVLHGWLKPTTFGGYFPTPTTLTNISSASKKMSLCDEEI